MRILIKRHPLGYDDMRDWDYGCRCNYELETELSTDLDPDVWVDIDDEINMFAQACLIEGYDSNSILKGFERYVDYNSPESSAEGIH